MAAFTNHPKLLCAALLVALAIPCIVVSHFTSPFLAIVEPTIASACPHLQPSPLHATLAQQYAAAGVNYELGTALLLARPDQTAAVCQALNSAFQHAWDNTPQQFRKRAPRYWAKPPAMLEELSAKLGVDPLKAEETIIAARNTRLWGSFQARHKASSDKAG